MIAPSLLELDDSLIPLRNGLGAVPGVRLAGVHSGIKPRKRDLALIAFDGPRVAASVVTTNEIKAAPVLVSARHLAASATVRALVCNSGCANACTGERGERDAIATARQAAALLSIAPEEVLVASTGVIGVPLPMDRLQRGVERAVGLLDQGGKAAQDAAEAIMTTDRVPKLAAYAFYHRERKYVVGGIAKGSGMIAPNMATMLAFVATDFPLSREALQSALAEAADGTFNMISVDGDMSTNDAVYAFAPPGKAAAAPEPAGARLPAGVFGFGGRDGERRRGRDQTARDDRQRSARRRAGSQRRAGRREQQSGENRLVRRGPELGAHRRRRRLRARRHRSGAVVALHQRQNVGRAGRGGDALRGGGASRARAIRSHGRAAPWPWASRSHRVGMRSFARLRAHQRELPHVSVPPVADPPYLPTYDRAPITIVAGAGCYVADDAGRRYLDALGGIAVCALGHAHPAIAEAVSRQAATLVHASNLYGHEPAGTLARELVERSGLAAAFFCNSGTEANEAAIKLARKAAYRRSEPDRVRILACTGSFHGRTLGALAATANDAYKVGFGPLPEGFAFVPFNDAAALEAALDETVAALIVEPVQGESGVHLATVEFLRAARRLCDEWGALLIFDEIQCGAGRLGPFFAFDAFGVTPDVVTMAKALANGLPIGAVLAGERAAGGFAHGDHGSTFGGSPIPCAAALAHLRVRDELDLERNVAQRSTQLFAGLSAIAAANPGITLAPRGRGLLAGLPIRAPHEAREVARRARELGLLVGTAGGNTIRLAPPLIVSAGEIDSVLHFLAAAVETAETA